MKQKNTGSNPFSNQAGSYKKYRPVYPSDLYDFIFQHLNRRQNAWDCGTGSGQAAGYLADHFEKVYANDISRSQLDHAIQKKNIHYFNKPGEDAGFPADFFDLITVAQAIHWMDFGRFYEEVTRTGRKDALIAVFGYGRVQTSGNFQQHIDKLYDNVFSKYYSLNRRFVEESYRSIPFPFKEIPAPQFEFHTRWSVDELEGYFNTWSAVQKYKDEYSMNPVNQVVDEIKKSIRTDSRLYIRFPVFLRLGLIHKNGSD